MAKTLRHVLSMLRDVNIFYFPVAVFSTAPHCINSSLGCFGFIMNVLLIELGGAGAFACLFQFSRLEGAIEYTSSGYTLQDRGEFCLILLLSFHVIVYSTMHCNFFENYLIEVS